MDRIRVLVISLVIKSGSLAKIKFKFGGWISVRLLVLKWLQLHALLKRWPKFGTVCGESSVLTND